MAADSAEVGRRSSRASPRRSRERHGRDRPGPWRRRERGRGQNNRGPRRTVRPRLNPEVTWPGEARCSRGWPTAVDRRSSRLQPDQKGQAARTAQHGLPGQTSPPARPTRPNWPNSPDTSLIVIAPSATNVRLRGAQIRWGRESPPFDVRDSITHEAAGRMRSRRPPFSNPEHRPVGRSLRGVLIARPASAAAPAPPSR
jgi:hypothetical protein